MLSGRDIYSWLSLCDPEVLPHDTPPPDGPCYPRMCHLAVGRWTRPTNTGDPHPTNTVYTCIEILTKWNPQIQIWGMLGFAVAPWGFADSKFPAEIQTNVLLTFIYLISSNILVTNMIIVSTYFDISKWKVRVQSLKTYRGKGGENWGQILWEERFV